MGLNDPSSPPLREETRPPDQENTTECKSDANPVLQSKGDVITNVDGFTALKDGFLSAKNWSTQLYKRVVESSETTVRAVAEKVKLEDVGTNVQQILKQVPLIREFQQSQAEFEASRASDTGDAHSIVLPWHPDVSGLSDEAMVEKLRARILALSKQPNTFLLAPPAEAQIAESLSSDNLQLAKALLREDPNLESMRYNLVPKKISEDLFWRNYFYRVSVVRQSFQLSAMSGSTTDDAPDFVCIEDSAVWNEFPPGDGTSNNGTPIKPEESPSEKQTAKHTPKKVHSKGPKKHKPQTRSTTVPDEKVPSSKENSSELTAEELLEAELAREVDELVLVSSKPGEPDELERELEMELLAELDREQSS